MFIVSDSCCDQHRKFTFSCALRKRGRALVKRASSCYAVVPSTLIDDDAHQPICIVPRICILYLHPMRSACNLRIVPASSQAPRRCSSLGGKKQCASWYLKEKQNAFLFQKKKIDTPPVAEPQDTAINFYGSPPHAHLFTWLVESSG